MSEIRDLLSSVSQSTRAQRQSLRDEIEGYEQAVARLQSAVIMARAFVEVEGGFPERFFEVNQGPGFSALRDAYAVVQEGERAVADLAGIDELLENVSSSPHQTALEVLHRLKTYIAHLPELTARVEKAGVDGLAAWAAVFSPQQKARLRAKLVPPPVTPTRRLRPPTILTPEVSQGA